MTSTPIARRPGRPPKAAAYPLGKLIWKWLQVKDISPQEFARRLGVSRTTVWRLLQGKTTYMLRTSVADVCAALQLSEDERAAFVQACLALDKPLQIPYGPHAETSRAATALPPPSDRHSLRLTAHATACSDTREGELWGFIARTLDAQERSCTAFARAVGVAPSTVTRALRREIRCAHALRPERLARALQLDPVDRREFLALALDAGILAVAVRTANVGRPEGPFAAFERQLGRSVHDIEQEVIELRRRRNQGDVATAFVRAQQLFTQLFAPTVSRSTPLRASFEVARVKLLVGFEYAEAQAAHLPWYARETQMIATLNHMEQGVIQRFPPTQFASEYGHLFNLRAPLYRRPPEGWSGETAYQTAIFEFGTALRHTISAQGEPTLHVELLRNRAHTHLLNQDIGKWRADLEAAQRVANGLRGEVGEQFQALVTYSWGEGYKRAAELPNLSEAARRRHLQDALDCLAQGERTFLRHPLWHGYALLAGIAQAQCLASIAPEEALRRLSELRVTAELIYPSLVAKIARSQAAVRRT